MPRSSMLLRSCALLALVTCVACNALFSIEEPIRRVDEPTAGAGPGGSGGSAGKPGAGEAGSNDASSAGSAGAPSVCGNGLLETDEACDDANGIIDDGCSECAVKDGYSCDGESPTTCSDIDECAAGEKNDCSAYATCTNTVGSYDCKCKTGWLGNGVTCTRPSCVGMDKICGVNGDDDCCASPTVPGGTVFRGNDSNFPATLKSFTLDKYEVTVGRYNKFVREYVDLPRAGDGAHPDIPLSGWQSAWSNGYPANPASLAANVSCNENYQTWRGNDAARAASTLPINCISWYDAVAFCAFDGGHLPTDAEFEYAAAGGTEDRTYPWGEQAPTSVQAVFGCKGDKEINCTFADIRPVGSVPEGAGRWGQLDLSGSMYEWVLDAEGPYVTPCLNNCADLDGDMRINRGGMWEYPTLGELKSSWRDSSTARNTRQFPFGLRCATSSP